MPALADGSFRDRLLAAMATNDTLLCVGLDPDPVRFPPSIRDAGDIAAAILAFNARIIEATCDVVCAYKPNLAFYLAHGAPGIEALQATRKLIPDHIPAILDAKIGDVSNTTAAYAEAVFDTLSFDAVTVNPYLGEDALEPFLKRAGAGIIVLCKTSNPGSGDVQDLHIGQHGTALYLNVAAMVATWNERWPADLGLVVGATFPAELANVRDICPDLPILLPGVGAQAGELSGAVEAGIDARGRGLLVNASRSVIYAKRTSEEHDWAEAVRSAALVLRDEINAVRGAQ
jgi:orotidine-5'-phosphate decarboxylase